MSLWGQRESWWSQSQLKQDMNETGGRGAQDETFRTMVKVTHADLKTELCWDNSRQDLGQRKDASLWNINRKIKKLKKKKKTFTTLMDPINGNEKPTQNNSSLSLICFMNHTRRWHPPPPRLSWGLGEDEAKDRRRRTDNNRVLERTKWACWQMWRQMEG